ncbi:MAG: DUF4126 domain-containing protein [Bacteroidales bacterium]
MDIELITAVAIGIGLAASSGFRVFVPMLVAAVAARAGILPVNESFQWLSSNTAIICFATATLIEIIAYYIPFIDNLLDTLSVPLATIAGTLLLTSVLPIDSEFIRWITGAAVGGGAALTVESGSAVTRLLSTKMTASTANPLVATGENVAAVGSSILSLLIPFVVAAAFLLLIIFIISRLGKKRKKRRNHLMST